MSTKESAITVEEVSMQEWAMLAFHAERAPQRVRVTVKKVQANAVDERAVGGVRTGLWMMLAAAMGAMAWWVM